MAGVLNLLSKLFGNKYDKDVKKISPIIEEINIQYEKLKTLTHDELRNITPHLRKKITDFISEEKKQIQSLKTKSNSKEISTQDKENLYKKIDALEKTILEKIEAELIFLLFISPIIYLLYPYFQESFINE